MNYWQLSCNPAVWDIQRKLKSSEELDDWVFPKSYKDKIKKGDLGIIRVNIDKRNQKAFMDLGSGFVMLGS